MRVPESPWVRLVVLLGLTGAFGALAVLATPAGGTAIGIWPVALATSILLVTDRPAWPIVTGLVGVVAAGTIALDRPTGVAVGLGIGLAAEATLTWAVWSGGRRGIPSLRTNRDLARLLVAVTVGAITIAGVAAVTSALTDWGTPTTLALTAATSGLASQLVLLPLVARLRRPAPLAGRGERLAQWANVVAVPVLVLLYVDASVTLVLVLPSLIWSSMRSHAYEAFAHLVVAAGIVVTLTTLQLGPLAGNPVGGFGADSQGVLLGMFVATCALVVLTLVVNVGEQREQQRLAAAERDRVQRIVNGTTGIAIVGTDLDTTITLFNPGAERLYGYRAHEVLGRPTSMLVSPADGDRSEDGHEASFATYRRSLVDAGPTVVEVLRKDGAVRQHLLTISPVRDDSGTEIGYVTTAEDITERVEAEEHLREALAAERTAVERLQEVDQAKDRFVSNVSHELRTPITSILGYIELLDEGAYGELTAEQREAIARIARNSSRLLSLIGDLLTLSRIQESGPELAHQLLDLRDVVSHAMTTVTAAHQRPGLTLGVDLPPEPVPHRGDRDQLERVVINLVSNALKFTPDGGRVDVRLWSTPEAAVLEVADTGIGIPAEEQDRLFERFFRSSLSEHHEIPGTGLGLPITRTSVERHGGTIEVESEQGCGATFRVTLPLPERPRNDPSRIGD